jgi:hypothetical protein
VGGVGGDAWEKNVSFLLLLQRYKLSNSAAAAVAADIICMSRQLTRARQAPKVARYIIEGIFFPSTPEKVLDAIPQPHFFCCCAHTYTHIYADAQNWTDYKLLPNNNGNNGTDDGRSRKYTHTRNGGQTQRIGSKGEEEEEAK